MKKLFYLPVLAFAVAAVSCGNKTGELTAGIDVTNMDTTVVPGVDFYKYSCGGWMEKHPLTDQYGRYGSFDMLAENNTKQIKGLIEELAGKKAEAGSDAYKIGTLYNIAMDSAKLNKDGFAPVKAELEMVDAVKSNAELPSLVAKMMRKGYSPYFFVYVGSDEKNSKMNLVQAYQAGLTLGNRDYYVKNDENNKEIRAKYEKHIANMFELAGYGKSEAAKAAKDVMKVETSLAEIHYE